MTAAISHAAEDQPMAAYDAGARAATGGPLPSSVTVDELWPPWNWGQARP